MKIPKKFCLIAFTIIILHLSGVLSLATSLAQAQGNTRKNESETTHDRERFKFEVVSIRLHKPGAPYLPRQLTADSYRSSMSTSDMIKLAYSPLTLRYANWSRILNAPRWINEMYDIHARIDEKDQKVWQNAQLNSQIFKDDRFERDALRAVLEEEFKLQIHITPIEVPYLNLMVDKHSEKLRDSVSAAVAPVGIRMRKLGDGFYFEENGERKFVGVSMPEFAAWLAGITADLPIQDKTGLTGRYDFNLPLNDDRNYPEFERSDPIGALSLKSIGLTLKKGKGPAFRFTIEHIERPNDN
jgi:uncharacterized protein (TIGR03435 family)